MKNFFVAFLLLGSAFFIHFPAFAVESETVKGAQKDFQKFKTEMSSQLNDLDKKINELHKKTAESGSKAQEQAIHDLEATRKQLQTQLNTKMNEAQETTNKSWVEFKKNFAQSVDHLNEKIQSALKN